MNLTKNNWIRVVLAIAVVVVAVGAWGIGRASGEGALAQAAATTSNSEATGYDIGIAQKNPAPTGKIREFNLVAKEAQVEISPGIKVTAITYNGQVPGPLIRATEGDTVRVTLKNELNQVTAIHWHGLHVPNSMDGVPPFTQSEVAPGQNFTYEFTASHAGTFMYHSHMNAVEQIDRGLYGPLIIDPATPSPTKFDKEFTMMLSAWSTYTMTGTTGMMSGTTGNNGNSMMGGSSGMMGNGGMMGNNDSSDTGTTGMMSGTTGNMGGMGSMMSMMYNYFTINGKAFPSNETWTVKEGDLVRVRIMNISSLTHPMHLHGHDFTVVAKDGQPIRPELQQVMNTLSVDAGETYDIALKADNPGVWMFHCHELHHTENNGVEPGGLIQVIQYEGYKASTQTTKP